MNPSPSPSVTVAVPLHRSLPWVANVIANVRALPPMVTEVLLSDRTAEDDATDLLRAVLADDPRVRVIHEARGLSWTEHCRLLVEEATGDLMVLMPHDDIFPASWVPTLTQALAAHPDALLAYGALRLVEPDGITPTDGWQPRPLVPGVITGRRAVELYLDRQLGVPFRGVFRRPEMLAAGITIESPTAFPRGRVWTMDATWVLALAVHASIVHDDRTCARKRIHPASFIAGQAPLRPRAEARAGLTVLRRHGPRSLAGAVMALQLLAGWARFRVGTIGRRTVTPPSL